MEAKLMEYLTYFEFVDLLGFAKMMDVEPELIKKVVIGTAAQEPTENSENWEQLICSIVENFSQRNRKNKKLILKMAKQIKEDNLKLKEKS